MSRARLAALPAAAMLFFVAAAPVPAPAPAFDIIPDGYRPLRWLGTTFERGDFDSPRGAGWMLLIDIAPQFDEPLEVTDAATELPSGRYGYRLFALPEAVAAQWRAADEATRGKGIRDFAEARGIEGVSFAGSRKNVPTWSDRHAFRARVRATLSEDGLVGVETVKWELFGEGGELLVEADVMPPPEPEFSAKNPRVWTIGLVVVVLGSGVVWLLRRRRRSKP